MTDQPQVLKIEVGHQNCFQDIIYKNICCDTAYLAPLLRPMPYLMSKKGDWDRPGKESITPAEGREPEKDHRFSLKPVEAKFFYCTHLLSIIYQVDPCVCT